MIGMHACEWKIIQRICYQLQEEGLDPLLTLTSRDGDSGNVCRDFLASSSDEQSEHKKCSNFFASSIVIPIQEG